jgi:polyferredoxin/Flp pilus assembly protein TadD
MALLPVLQDRPASRRPQTPRVRPEDHPPIRPSRSSKRRAAVLIGVHLLIAGHIAHWLLAGTTVTPVEPSEAMAFSKAGIINAGLLFFAAAILATAVFGRFFCGWACHLVALQDLCRWLLEKAGIRPKPLRSRLLRLVPALAFAYMFLWPVAYRLWIGDSFRRHGTEFTTSHFWATFPGWAIGGLTFLLCGFVIVYFLGAKGFCTYACPYGAVFGVAERLSPLRIRVTDACAGCAHCTAVCTSNVRVHEEVRDYGMVVNPGCMKCLDCVSVCPNDALYYGAGPIPWLAKPRVAEPARPRPAFRLWEEVVLGAAFAAAFFTFRGLYGTVPFLMSLGVAGILAYVVLLALQMVARRDVGALYLQLRRGGRLTGAGRAFAGALALVLAFWAHSAVIRLHAFLGERAYARTAGLRAAALDLGREPRPASDADRALVRRALSHLERVRDWGLFPTLGNAGRLAWLYLLAGDSAALARQSDVALERGEAAAMHQLVARDAWARGDAAAAVAGYERAVAADPGSEAPYLALGAVLAGSGDLVAAGQVFDSARQRLGDSSNLLYNAGLTRALLGDGEGAIALFEAVLARDPEHLQARENLAGLLAGAGRFEASVAHFRAALARVPDDARTRLLLARALAGAGRRQEAAAELREALRLAPGLGEARALLAELGPPNGGGGR